MNCKIRSIGIAMALIIVGTGVSRAQYHSKPPIDTAAYAKWHSVNDAVISSDGKYMLFANLRGQLFSNQKRVGVTVTSTDGKWVYKIPGNVTNTKFSPDNRFATFMINNDTFGILKTGTSSIRYLTDFTKAGAANGISFMIRNGAEQMLVIQDLMGKKIKEVTGIEGIFTFHNSDLVAWNKASVDHQFTTFNTKTGRLHDYTGGKILRVFEHEESSKIVLATQASPVDQPLNYYVVDGVTGLATRIGEGKALSKVVWGKSRNIALQSEDGKIWHYDIVSSKTRQLNIQNEFSKDSSLVVESIDRFSDDETKLFFTWSERQLQLPDDPSAVPLNIWSYTDNKLVPEQEAEIGNVRKYESVLNITTGKINRLMEAGEEVLMKSDDYYLLKRNAGYPYTEINWSRAAISTFRRVNVQSGESFVIDYLRDGRASPDKKFYVIFKDNFSYALDISKGTFKKISGNIKTYYTSLGWADNCTSLLITDGHDIWSCDVTGNKEPVNITNHFGAKNKISFELIDEGKKVINKNDKIVLTYFNPANKENGFYSMVYGEMKDPVKLSGGDYLQYAPFFSYTSFRGLNGFAPLKAANGDVYIIKRMSQTTAPNFFSTKDFKEFVQLSSVATEKEYNWYTISLHRFAGLYSDTLSGLLFKPENFDSTKKYPLIFHYYEGMTNSLNAYFTPVSSSGRLNIPWCVSNEYLVFVPDIHFTIDETAKSVVNAVAGAAKYLSAFSFVDTSKFGAQGESFGGWETNVLVTHTDFLKAACTSSGTANLSSQAAELLGGQVSTQDFHQFRMSDGFARIPEKWKENSPIFKINNVTAPLLIFHTKDDEAVHFPQALEMFLGLRRLGKKAWLLQYNEGNHGVYGPSSYDFDLRLQQFFNHYLKGMPAPKWMLQGVPAKMKNKDRGFELGKPGESPGPGLLK